MRDKLPLTSLFHGSYTVPGSLNCLSLGDWKKVGWVLHHAVLEFPCEPCSQLCSKQRLLLKVTATAKQACSLRKDEDALTCLTPTALTGWQISLL